MPQVDDPSNLKEQIRQLMARVRALETSTMLANASIERGRTRWYDGSEVLIEDSNLTVSGTATVAGTIELDGDMNVAAGGRINVAGSAPMRIGQMGSLVAGVWWGGSTYPALYGNASTVAVAGGSQSFLSSSSSETGISSNGCSISVSASGVTTYGDVKFDNLPTISAAGRTPNLWIDPTTKQVYRLI